MADQALVAVTKGRDWSKRNAPRFRVIVRRGKVGACWRSILARIHYAKDHLHKCADQADMAITAQCEDEMTADTWQSLLAHELPGIATSRLANKVGFTLSVEQLQKLKLPEREGKAVRVISIPHRGSK